MERRSLICAGLLLLAGCGGSSPKAAVSPLAKRCHLDPLPGDGGFPAGLLGAGAVITGDGVALVPGRLADVYRQLLARGASAGELETLDAELEFGDVALALSVPRACTHATQVSLGG